MTPRALLSCCSLSNGAQTCGYLARYQLSPLVVATYRAHKARTFLGCFFESWSPLQPSPLAARDSVCRPLNEAMDSVLATLLDRSKSRVEVVHQA